MKILLIDADSTIPNLALMKLAQFYRDVSFSRLYIPYYQNRRKQVHYVDTTGYDKVFCSVVFNGNANFVKGDNITFGGTGYSLSIELPLEIENLDPNYSIYPENDTSYGFITRGCIRNCKFCCVPQKEGWIRQVSTIDRIVRHKKVKFLDNNILAFPDHLKILDELVSRKVKCQFNQGLDIRLVNNENSDLLSRMNYWGEYTFAFDDISYMEVIEKKMDILNWRKDWQFRFFVYTHPNMSIDNIVRRIRWLRKNRCLPYVMRDISCWKSKHRNFYTDLASWCNQPNLFKKMDFDAFLDKRHIKNKNRVETSYNLYFKNYRL